MTAAMLEGHGGALAVAVARRHGVRAMFTLSGAHVFPLYDGAVKADPPLPLIDVRHEQTAVFAAEGTAKLTRTPGLAVLTAGPGVTNGISAVTTAHFNGSPVLILGGRAPTARWGSGALQELDHPPLLAPVTKRAATVTSVGRLAAEVDAALRLACSPHRGPVFLDIPMDERDGLLVTRARSLAFGTADLVLVVGAPLDFRLGYGSFGGRDGGSPPAKVVHVVDAPSELAAHVELAGAVSGDLGLALDGLVAAFETERERAGGTWPEWLQRLRGAAKDAEEGDRALLESDAEPIHPARVYGELRRVLDDDAVVIGDGGDFVSFAGRFLEPAQPGCWLDPGPYGCLGTGLGYAIAARLARPSSQVVLLLGDGAAGLSLMDVDTLVRHRLPVVLVCGNNGIWGLEKHPMQAMYGYDVAADLQPACRYDQVVAALGGAGELVTAPADLGPALRRAFAAGVPYLVNVATDPKIAYPRSTTGI